MMKMTEGAHMMSNDLRYDMASELADKIRKAADELSSAIYEANRSGYRAAVRIDNAVMIGDDSDGIRCIGGNDGPLSVKATVAFDIGKAVL